MRCRVPLVLALLLIAGGCTPTESPETSTSKPHYKMGEMLSDSSYALVVESSSGTDTVGVKSFQERFRMLRGQQELENHPPARSPNIDTSLARKVVDQIVSRHVMVGEVQRRGIQVDSGRLERRVDKVKRKLEEDSTFQRSLDSVWSREANNLRLERLWETLAGRAEAPTESEIEEYRREQRQKEVRLRYILFEVDSDAPRSRRDSVRVQAEAVLDSIEDGASFATMAERHSDSPTATIGGKTPSYQPEDQFADPVEKTVSTLRDSGERVQEPVRARDGFYIIQLEDRRLSPLMGRGEARWKLLNERRRDSVAAARRALMEEAVVRVNPEVVPLSLGRE